MADRAELPPPPLLMLDLDRRSHGGEEIHGSPLMAMGKDPDTPDGANARIGKPPRSVIRHCVSTARITSSTDLVQFYVHDHIFVLLLYSPLVFVTNRSLSYSFRIGFGSRQAQLHVSDRSAARILAGVSLRELLGDRAEALHGR